MIVSSLHLSVEHVPHENFIPNNEANALALSQDELVPHPLVV